MKRQTRGGLLLAAVLLGLGAWLATRPGAAPPALAPAPSPAAPAPAPTAASSTEPGPAAAPPLLLEPPPGDEPRSPVDLAALRRQLPDNLYWTLGVPTADPEVAKARAAEAQRWNAVFGRVQAGEAADDELHAYFEHQRRLHQDYLEFSAAVLDRYGEGLSERDRGLHELSVRMHHDRLEELPRLEAEAVARKAEQDRRRQAWEAAGRK